MGFLDSRELQHNYRIPARPKRTHDAASSTKDFATVLGPRVRAAQDVDYSYSVKYIYTVLKSEETTKLSSSQLAARTSIDESY
jgi:hypothetical protein